MTLLEVALLGAAGAVAFEVLEIRGRLATVQQLRHLDWPAEILGFITKLILGSIGAILLIGTAAVSGITVAIVGAAVPSILSRLGQVNKVQEALKIKEYQTQISTEAEQLAKIREPRSHDPEVSGVSLEVVDILAARREALAGQLPVVDPRDEERASS